MDGTGIVYWPPPHNALKLNLAEPDFSTEPLLVEPIIIPGTGYRRNRSDRAQETLASRIGMVTDHIVLEGYIVFTTNHDRIFSYRTTYPIVDFPQPEPVELTTFYPDSPSSFRIRDLQGSFRSFALFTTSGSVLTASCHLLDIFHLPPGASSPLPYPKAIPGLQGQSIISLAFGDHHWHALHATGTIASYGTELQGCGALGLGCQNAGKLRGLRIIHGSGRDRKLGEGEGRTVWFDPMMHTWLKDMSIKRRWTEPAQRTRMMNDGHDGACNAIADYFEHEGRKWEDGLTAEGELGAYFALKVSAAGWHSAALVLVDENKAEMAQQKHLVAPPAASSPPPTAQAVQPPPPPVYRLAWLYLLLVLSVRRFLGLTARDTATAAEAATTTARHRREAAGNVPRKDDGLVYTWAQDPFPRLRMADGEVMPGEIEITEMTR